jgi:hypothetical protein
MSKHEESKRQTMLCPCCGGEISVDARQCGCGGRFVGDPLDYLNDFIEPPLTSKLLLSIVTPKAEYEIIIGDLIEEYVDVRLRIGQVKADFWFHAEVLISFWPLLCATLRRIKSVASPRRRAGGRSL